MNTAKVIPFRDQELLLVDNAGEAFVPMKPVVEGMGLDWKTQHRKLMSGRFESTMVEMTIVAQDGKQRDMTCLPLRKLTGWLMSIHPNKVRPELRDGIIAYQNECDDVLWSYWNDGIAVRRDDRCLNTLLGQTIGTNGFNILGAIIKGKVSRLPVPARRSATSKLWSQLHAAYGVRSAEDIPADQLDSARTFVAAYAIDGEYLPANDPTMTPLTDEQLYSVWRLKRHFLNLHNTFNQHNLYTHLTGLGSRAGIEMRDQLCAGKTAAIALSELDDGIEGVQRRLGVNGYA